MVFVIIFISTHSLTRRLTATLENYLGEKLFQLTASQGGWPSARSHEGNPLFISTHSLTRRLTDRQPGKSQGDYISTHSLTRRLTRHSDVSLKRLIFQLTASQGGWQLSRTHNIPMQRISTHSLTRRLTVNAPLELNTIFLFQLTASQGGWRKMYGRRNTENQKFQLTASQGGWQIQTVKEEIESEDFNSQPHKEADVILIGHTTLSIHFNSQPHKEADLQLNIFRVDSWYFNSQPHKEADFHRQHTFQCFWHFNSQPHKEADVTSSLVFFKWVPFQLTASQGGWRYIYSSIQTIEWFQLTASQGGWRIFHTHPKCLRIFQLTASQGGWLDTTGYLEIRGGISTHSLTRRLTATPWRFYMWLTSFQLTASQGISDIDYYFRFIISTHSLTRRLTKHALANRRTISISTHSLTRRLTVFPHHFDVV